MRSRGLRLGRTELQTKGQNFMAIRDPRTSPGADKTAEPSKAPVFPLKWEAKNRQRISAMSLIIEGI